MNPDIFAVGGEKNPKPDRRLPVATTGARFALSA
jgi:hypothetical protein